jgi:hypothetical protein
MLKNPDEHSGNKERFLAQNNLEFIGFELDRWFAFEAPNPATFAGSWFRT